MQITKIRLDGRTNIDLPIFGLRHSSRYIVKQVDGLGPPEVDVRIDQHLYLGRQPADREIVLRVGLNPEYATGETPASMRQDLYGLLTPGASDLIAVKLMNGPNILMQQSGAVKNIEINPFAKDPEVQITIDCLTSYFAAPAQVTFVPPLRSTFTVPYAGTVSTGFYLELDITYDWDTFSLYASEEGESGPKMRLDTTKFNDGDTLVIDTRTGRKGVKLLRGATTIRILDALSDDSIWFQLHPGDNTFWTSRQSFDWGQIIFTPLYWGI